MAHIGAMVLNRQGAKFFNTLLDRAAIDFLAQAKQASPPVQFMNESDQDLLQRLLHQASRETDHKKLMELTQQINRLLEAKEGPFLDGKKAGSSEDVATQE
ncbi:MAG TPA: hypothetical protein VF753_16845 [Terriglobales bacterium]